MNTPYNHKAHRTTPRRTAGQAQIDLTLTQAIEGYLLAAEARRLSPNTIADYSNTFRKFQSFLAAADAAGSNLPLSAITADHIEEFLVSQDTVSNKTLLNYHTSLSALYTWLLKEGIATANPMHTIERPTPEQRAIIPLTEPDIRLLLDAAGKSASYTRPGKAACANHQPPQLVERNRAIILLLLDTGMRASELANLCIHQLDLRNRQVRVFGKGAKERLIPLGARTGQALWRYISSYRKDATAGDRLFVTLTGSELDRSQLLKTLTRLGQRAGVTNCNPHRFRHTFSINYLRNSGDPWTLQILLGHTTMEMVRRYLAIAQSDLTAAHRRASPVDNWKL